MKKLLLTATVAAISALTFLALTNSGSTAEAGSGTPCRVPIYIDAVEVYSKQFSTELNRFKLGHMEQDRKNDGMPDPWLLTQGRASQTQQFAFNGQDSLKLCAGATVDTKRFVSGHAPTRIEFRIRPQGKAVNEARCLTIRERYSDYGDLYWTFLSQTYNMGSFQGKVFQKVVRHSDNPGASYLNIRFTYRHC